jgi:tyrosine decarboxylase/aspartate 1-decarboxylase
MPPAIPENGRDPQDVLAELDRRLAGDFSYASGRILGSMVSGPHELAARVFVECLEKNIGDPGLFPATAELEREVVAMVGALLAHPAAAGNVTSGGNESNILALWAARTRAGGERRQLIASAASHASYDKAARLLDLELVEIPVDGRQVIDVAAARRAIGPRTLAIAGVAGCTPLGLVDPIAELSALAEQHGVWLHVDAAFGGFVLPFLAALGRPAPAFDFRLPGVRSISLNPHKMGLAVQPAGILLYRDAADRRAIATALPYLAGGATEQTTLTGTRPGGAAVAVWAMLQHLGHAGYRQVVRACMETTDWLVARLRKMPGVELASEPLLNIVGLRPRSLPVADVASKLRAQGWAVAQFPEHVRLVVLPHLTRLHLEGFLDDLASCLGAGRPRRARRVAGS